MDNYEINNLTLAIVPTSDNKSIVYENGESVDVNLSTLKIMDNSCKFYGSSLQGREKGSSSLIKVRYKVPVIVEETNDIIFFPTNSKRNSNCAWLSLNNIYAYEEDNRHTKIIFKDGTIINLPISYTIIHNQILLSSRLLIKLKERKVIK